MPWLLVVVIGALLIVPEAHAQPFSVPKQLVGFYESESNVGPAHMPLAPRPNSTTDSEFFVVRQVGPLDIQAGDCLDVRAREQFSNSNPANGWWTIGGVQSEHWYLWVGVNLSLRYSVGQPSLANPGVALRPWTGEQWDWLIHHWHWDTSEKRCFTGALTNVYVFTPVYFTSSPSYRQSDSQYILNDQRGKVEVLQFGNR